MRRVFLFAFIVVLVGCTKEPVDFSEATIADLHDRMHRGEVTSEQLVSWYLDRIDAIDHSGPELRSILEVNPDALMTARALDEEWQESGPRGPLHGIPVVLKANIDTADQKRIRRRAVILQGK